MGVVICLPLFGPPSRELEEGAEIRGRQLRDLATGLTERLNSAADTLDRLAAHGWSARVGMYDALLARAGVETRDEAERRLRELGVSIDDLIIVEEPDDEDERPPHAGEE
jgi:hypothetical protein